ncbi:MAG TPA: hypothetical protein VMH22_12395 [bacterium]|nr:hypothetical protein [bacterium]
MQCEFLKHNGERCGAQAMVGTTHCYIHNPSISADEKRAAQARGGRTHAPVLMEPIPVMPVDAPIDVVTLLADTVGRVRSGELDPRIANCICALAGQLLRAFEIVQTASRIEKIERFMLNREARS